MAPTTERGFLARHRLAVLAASLVVFLPPLAVVFQPTGDTGFCGSWCPRMFWTWRPGMKASELLAGLARSWAGVSLVVLVLLATVFLSRAWCSHVCPVGGALELLSRLVPRRWQLDFRSIPAAPVRYGYLGVYLAAPALGIGSLCCNYCNFAAVPRLFGAAFTAADLAYFLRTAGVINLVLVLALGVFARGGRAYCNLLCPVGALDALVNRTTARFGRKVRLAPESCNGCGACARVCPTWAIQLVPGQGAGGATEVARIDALACLPCRDCEGVCQEGAIRYGPASS